MSETLEELGLGDRITVHTMSGKDETIIGRMQDGRVILFDMNSQYFSLLAPGQIVECHVVALRENFVVVSPISKPGESKPEAIPISPIPELEVDPVEEDLEKMIKSVPKNAKIILRALLRIIRLLKLLIKMLRDKV